MFIGYALMYAPTPVRSDVSMMILFAAYTAFSGKFGQVSGQECRKIATCCHAVLGGKFTTTKARAICGGILVAVIAAIWYIYSTTPAVVAGVDPAMYQQFNPFSAASESIYQEADDERAACESERIGTSCRECGYIVVGKTQE